MISALARQQARISELYRVIEDRKTEVDEVFYARCELDDFEAVGPPAEVVGAETVIDDARAVLVRAQEARLVAPIAKLTAI